MLETFTHSPYASYSDGRLVPLVYIRQLMMRILPATVLVDTLLLVPLTPQFFKLKLLAWH